MAQTSGHPDIHSMAACLLILEF